MSRAAVLRALLVPEARALPRPALAVAAGLGLLPVAVPLLSGWEADPHVGVDLLRVSALCGALGAAFVLDDPSRPTTGALPVPRPLRHLLRLVLVLPPAALWWAAAYGLARAGTAGGAELSVGGLTLEAAALCAAALGLAAAAVRCTGASVPGPAVMSAVLALAVAAAVLLPEGLAVFVPPGDERWEGAHDRWAVLLAVGAVLWAVCGREPLRRRTPDVTARR